MALSTLSRHCKHHVFPSFHGPDVRRGCLSYLLKEFKEKAIDVFIDNDIERSKLIGPELTEAIRGSLIAIVLISRNYASSTWCLNELVEIMRCWDEDKQTVEVIFYEVDPSDVKKQKGDFGAVFDKTCAEKSTEEVERWRKALHIVAQIAGYHTSNFDDDAVMTAKVVTDVSNKFNDSTTSNDSSCLVGIGTHIKEIESLLSLESDEVRMVGIWGPSGIGKTTIARALYGELSSKFTHAAFIESIQGKFEQNYRDEHAFKLQLQEQLLSKTLSQKDVKIGHLGVAKARLKDKKVLVVLDDVDDLKQLEAMTDKTCWFGPQSRIVITTKDKKLLVAHEINHIYHVDFPSLSEALEILCLSAFRHKSPSSGFEDMAIEVTRLAGRLPLGLCVFGAYLRGMSRDHWINALPRLRTSLDGEIGKVLRVSYEALCEEDQGLFLHIACFFKGESINDVVDCLAESRLNVKHGLQVLFDKCFISYDEWGRLVVHNLLEKLAKEIIRKQSVSDPGKRQFLVDALDICDVLEENAGTETIIGINFDLSEVRGELIIDERAFEGMSRLQFLRFKKRGLYDNIQLLLPQGLKFRASKLKFLEWYRFPLTCFPREFQPRRLVKLMMEDSNLEKLWEEPIPLPCLKLIELSGSVYLKELPDLSNATNLKVLRAGFCSSLSEISSIGKSTSLEELHLEYCRKLTKIPSSIGNAINLEALNVEGCEGLVELPSSIWSLSKLKKLLILGCSKLNRLGSQLRSFLDISGNITEFSITDTEIEEFPSSIMAFSCLRDLCVNAERLEVFPDVPDTIENLTLIIARIEEIPPSIQNLTRLTRLSLSRCKKLKVFPTNVNLQSLSRLYLSSCTQLRTFPEISTSISYLNLSDTSIEEVPSSIWSWPHLRELDLEDCRSLRVIHSFPDNIEELDSGLSDTGTDSSGGDSETRLPLCINLKGCKSLVSLPHIPYCVSLLDASNCKSLERIDGLVSNPERCLIFINCSKLSKPARELIEVSDCKSALFPGGELPADFDHRAREGLLTVQSHLPLFLRFKACLLLLHRGYIEDEDDEDEECMCGKRLSCDIWCVQNGVDVGHGSRAYYLPATLGSKEHLYFLESSISLNLPETDVNFSELHFEFYEITGKYWDVKDFAIKLLEDTHNEAEQKVTADIKIEKMQEQCECLRASF